jgi:hypothetical protein
MKERRIQGGKAAEHLFLQHLMMIVCTAEPQQHDKG